MKYTKPFVLGVIASLVVGVLYIKTPVNEALGAPATEVTYQKSLIPFSDSLYTIGTTTKAWLNGFFDEVCLAGDCRTSWPAAGGVSDWLQANGALTPSTTIGIRVKASSTITGLTVDGNETITGSSVVSSALGTGSLTVGNTLGSNGSQVRILGFSGTYKNWQMDVGLTGTGAFNITPSTAVGGSSFATPALSILGSGNVGIGTTSPSRLLTVAGDAIMANLTATGTASSSALVASNSVNLFGGGAKTTANDLCIQLTGSSALCDGSDDGGGGGSASDWKQLGGFLTPTTTIGLNIVATSTFATSSFTGPVTFSNDMLFPMLPPITNGIIQPISISVNSGTTTIYTTPIGKKAVLVTTNFRLYNYGTTSSVTGNSLGITVSGNYSGLINIPVTAAGAGLNVAVQSGIILNGGESLTTVTSGGKFNLSGSITEIPDTAPFYTYSTSTFSVGTTTLYTVPAGKKATLVQFGSQTIQQVSFYNRSGATVSNSLYAGVTADTSNQLYPATGLSNNTTAQYVLQRTLTAGESIFLGTSSSASGQFAWVNIWEY